VVITRRWQWRLGGKRPALHLTAQTLFLGAGDELQVNILLFVKQMVKDACIARQRREEPCVEEF